MPATGRAKERPQTQELPLEEKIRARAYELYVARGSESGSETEDWIQAEQEIMEAEEEKRNPSRKPESV